MTLLKLARKGCGLMLIMAAVASPAYAGDFFGPHHGSAPEMDPGSVGAALSMLAGGFLMIVDRCRR